MGEGTSENERVQQTFRLSIVNGGFVTKKAGGGGEGGQKKL